MFEILNKLSKVNTSHPALLSFITQEAKKPTMVDPLYAEAYVMGALRGDGDVPVDAKCNFVNGESQYKNTKTPLNVSVRGRTAIIDIKGGLVTRHEVGLCGSQASYEGLIATMESLMADEAINNIVARFSSGGGLVAGMEHASKHIRGLRGKGKRLYGIADTHALSAAYGLISAFDEVWVGYGCAVGSIGVYLKHVSFAERNKKAGVEVTYVYAGDFKVSGNSDHELDDVAKAKFSDNISRDYKAFTTLVADNRGIDVSTVVNTQAQWYTEGYIELGLADRTGSFTELLNHIESIDMNQAEIDKLKADAKAEGKAEAETEAKLAQELADNKLKEDQAVEARRLAAEKTANEAARKETITAMCNVAGLDADATAAYVDSEKSVADVTVDLQKLADNSGGVNQIDTSGKHASNTPKADEAWAKVDWN